MEPRGMVEGPASSQAQLNQLPLLLQRPLHPQKGAVKDQQAMPPLRLKTMYPRENVRGKNMIALNLDPSTILKQQNHMF